MNQHIIIFIKFLLVVGSWIVADSRGEDFSSAHSVREAKEQHERLPTEDIWWTVNGPDMRWNFKNLHQLFPTVNVYRNGPVKELASNANVEISKFPVGTPIGQLPFSEFIKSEFSTAMGVIVLHKGEIAFESYPRMESHEKPIYWSVAKSLVGTLVRILEERDRIDTSKSIDVYLPDLKGSSLEGTPIRHLLDMASGLDCADDYEDKESCYYQYSVTIGDGFTSEPSIQDPYEFVSTLQAKRLRQSGKSLSYSGLNTFVLAWLVEVITDMPFQDALTKEIWWQIGAESDAAYIAPIKGIPVTHGGFLAKMRDLARFGLLFTPSQSKIVQRPLISEDHVAFLLSQGDSQLLKNAGLDYLINSGVKHNIYQWDAVHANGSLYKGGWAGQGLFINPKWDVVAVFTSYYKDDDHSEIPLTPIMMQMLNTVYEVKE